MSNLPLFILLLAGYVILTRIALRIRSDKVRLPLFAIFNIAFVALLSLQTRYHDWEPEPILSLGQGAVVRHLALIGFYVLIVAAGYFLMRALANKAGMLPWIAFSYPILVLILFKYFYFAWEPFVERLGWDDWVLAATIIGLSYMAFRLSFLVLEVRNEIVEMPSLSGYLGFAFFLPTMIVGPINPFSVHKRSLDSGSFDSGYIARSFLRVAVGSVKFLFLANLANQLSYAGIFLDQKPHGPIDLVVAAVFYYIFLYLNFSGICDIAIGIAGLLGIRVIENFDNPFLARNIKDFWNRWHISLSVWARDIIFSPLSKYLIRRFGIGYTNAALTVTTFVVFLVIGVWHGVGWRFALFGVIHAAGVIGNYYYTIFLKKRLGKEGFRKYNKSKLIHAIAVVTTFAYVTASFSVFANSYNQLGIIKNAITEGFFISGN
ncbi:MAG: hypothetical protein IPM63_01655 [Acidobacteriota bacterium]|nr:MAG: hypothetical protein IPM63_01655 [Acidobacteriota bacterium]